MRLVRLHLKAFGPFRDSWLDFPHERPGLHVLYGHNEAGKSSALRALEALLFGISGTDSESFQHTDRQVRVGAEIELRDGTRLDFYRRKGRRFVDKDDHPLEDDTALKAFVESISQSTYQTMFGLDRMRLERGGEEIVRGGGEIGRILFSAAGQVDLQRIQGELSAAHRDIFLPKGRIQRFAKLFADWKQCKKELRAKQLAMEEWNRVDAEQRECRQRQESLVHALRQWEREKRELIGLRDARIAAIRRAERGAELENLAGVPFLPLDFTQRRREAQTKTELARSRLADLEKRLADVADRLAQAPPAAPILTHQGEIESLHKRLGEIEKGIRDEAGLKQRFYAHAHQARELLREMEFPPTHFDDPDALRLRPEEARAIDDLGRHLEGIRRDIELHQRDVRRAEGTIRRLEADLLEIPQARESAELRRVLDAASTRGDLESQIEQVRLATEGMRDNIVKGLNSLRLPHVDPLNLNALPIPLAETIARCDEERVRLLRLVASVDERRTTIEIESSNRARELATFEAGEVPTLESLDESREVRDRLWRSIRGNWLADPSEVNAAEIVTRADRLLRAEEYQDALRKSDGIADRLRQEADRVRQRAFLQAEAARLAAAHHELETEEARITSLQAAWDSEWRHAWKDTGHLPTTPAEARAWLQRLGDLVMRADHWRAEISRLRELERDRERHMEELTRSLNGVGEEIPADANWQRVLELGRATLERSAAKRQQWEENRKARGEAQQLHEEANHNLLESQAKEASCHADWKGRMQRLGLEDDATPEIANARLAAIREFREHQKAARERENRIRHISQDRVEFDRDWEPLAARLLQPVPTKPEEALTALNQLLRTAIGDQSRFREWLAERDEIESQRATARAEVEERSIELGAFHQEAGVEDSRLFDEVEEQSRRKRELREQLAREEEHLDALRDATPLDEFAQRAASADPDAIGERIEQIENEIKVGNADLEKVHIRIGELKSSISRMSGADDAARVAQELEEIASQLGSTVREYQVIRLASGILQETIQRYRQRNEGRVLRRAGDLFQGLTCGRFKGLIVEQGESGEQFLAGERTAEQTHSITVAEMSDGTRDQLYLALRIASLEVYLAHQEPLPFVADDLLLTFDDERAVAALRALTELSRSTQVLFFTHHQHLVDLAVQHLPSEDVLVHQIG